MKNGELILYKNKIKNLILFELEPYKYKTNSPLFYRWYGCNDFI